MTATTTTTTTTTTTHTHLNVHQSGHEKKQVCLRNPRALV